MARLLWLKFLVYTSFRNLLRSPRRTLISLLAIAAAAAAMLVFQSFVNGVRSTFRVNVITSVYGHYQIYPKGFREEESDSPFSFHIDDIPALKKKVESIGELTLFARRQPFYGLINFNDHSVGGVGFGVDSAEERKFLTLTEVYEGKHLADSGEESIFIGFKLAKRLRVKPGDMVTVLVTTKTGSLNALDLEVVGTFKTGITELDQGTYQIHHDVAHKLLKTESAPLVVIGFKDDNELQYKEQLEQMVAKDFPELVPAHWQKLAEFFDNTMRWIQNQVIVFRTIILVIATLSIITVFMMGLFERTGEFGTMRAIGTHRHSLAGMIFIESIFQSLLGSLVGVGIALLIIKVFLGAGIMMPPPPMMTVPFLVKFAVPWSDMPWTVAMCVLVAGGAGIFPAVKIARMSVTEALGRNM